MSTLTSYKQLQVVTPTPSGAGGLALNNNFKGLADSIGPCNYTATTDPTTSDNQGSTPAYFAGSRWFNTSTNDEFVCISSTMSTAVWEKTTGGNTTPTLQQVTDAGNSTTDDVSVANLFLASGKTLSVDIVKDAGSGTVTFSPTVAVDFLTANSLSASSGLSVGSDVSVDNSGDIYCINLWASVVIADGASLSNITMPSLSIDNYGNISGPGNIYVNNGTFANVIANNGTFANAIANNGTFANVVTNSTLSFGSGAISTLPTIDSTVPGATAGQIGYDPGTNKAYVWDGSVWNALW